MMLARLAGSGTFGRFLRGLFGGWLFRNDDGGAGWGLGVRVVFGRAWGGHLVGDGGGFLLWAGLIAAGQEHVAGDGTGHDRK